MKSDTGDFTLREKLRALSRVATFRLRFTLVLIVFGAGVAFLEGIGLTFIYPILEVAQDGITDADDPIMQAFLTVYDFVGVPLSLGYLILGISLVFGCRYTASFLVQWLTALLRYDFETTMRDRAFDAALEARIGYYDEAGSDDILNAIITETRYSGNVISQGVNTMTQGFLALMYLAVMLYITPWMTLLALGLLATITVVIRRLIEPAVTVGTEVAHANEHVQRAVQAGTQGIRDIKLFTMSNELYDGFRDSLSEYKQGSTRLDRNKAAVKNAYDLSAAVTLFVLIYVGFAFTDLTLAGLGIFLFAMFQLAPKASVINSGFYSVEGNLPHIVRTYGFIDELAERREDAGDRPVDQVDHVVFEDVSFRYTDDESVLREVSFTVERGEFIAFVGQSGAGKSTIVSLLARLYTPDGGEITGDGVPIKEYDLQQWRERIAVVRQQPFIFNDTLHANIKIGNRDATRRDVERVAEIAKVDEFVDELPNGFDSQLGDDGVRLSGGQRQRVALARALLKDADFLVLDEATSDLDSNLEREVQRAIEAMDHDYGIIAIAHRLSTVENADVIHTVEQGRITESGTHDELVDDGGKYAELYAIQSSQ